MVDQVVCCTDGSDASIAAIPAGLAAIHVGDRPVVLLTVVPDLDATMVTGTGFAGGVMSPEEFQAEAAARRSAGEATTASVAAVLAGWDVRTEVAVGTPGPTICAFAADAGAIAVLVGTRGRGGVARALLGSVSDYVVRNAPCPVVVSGTPQPRSSGPVVVCTDGSDLSVQAATSALPLIAPEAPYVIATVLDRPRTPIPYDGSSIEHTLIDPEEQRLVAEHRLAAGREVVARTAETLGIVADLEVLEGDAGPALCDLADRLSARALVVGTRGHGGLRRAVLGSVSDYLVRNAPCPVIVTNPQSGTA